MGTCAFLFFLSFENSSHWFKTVGLSQNPLLWYHVILKHSASLPLQFVCLHPWSSRICKDRSSHESFLRAETAPLLSLLKHHQHQAYGSSFQRNITVLLICNSLIQWQRLIFELCVADAPFFLLSSLLSVKTLLLAVAKSLLTDDWKYASVLFPSKAGILWILQALPCSETPVLSHHIWQYAHSVNKPFWIVTSECT